jgi:NTP pyrophosphatase (non-canonical NTP hydrolase)
MKLDEYQNKAQTTFLRDNVYKSLGGHPLSSVIYLGLKLSGEAGEVGEKIGKLLRDKDGRLSTEDRQELIKELGDVLWYTAVLTDELDVSLEHVAQTNLNKLASRKERGVIGGSGDNR